MITNIYILFIHLFFGGCGGWGQKFGSFAALWFDKSILQAEVTRIRWDDEYECKICITFHFGMDTEYMEVTYHKD